MRVSAIDIPMPYAKNLEEAVVPGPDTIIKAVRNIMIFSFLNFYIYSSNIHYSSENYLDLNNLL